MEVEMGLENVKSKQSSKHKIPEDQTKSKEIIQVLTEVCQVLEQDMNLDNLNTDEWVMVAYLRI